MGKNDFIDLMSVKFSITKKEASIIIDRFTDTVIDAMSQDKEVQLIGFGSFSIAHIPAREGRNPRTGEALQVKAHKQPKFRAGQKLKEACNK